jgi:hypothetical protein
MAGISRLLRGVRDRIGMAIQQAVSTKPEGSARGGRGEIRDAGGDGRQREAKQGNGPE